MKITQLQNKQNQPFLSKMVPSEALRVHPQILSELGSRGQPPCDTENR